MLQIEQIRQEILQMKKGMDELKVALDIENSSKELMELEEKANERYDDVQLLQRLKQLGAKIDNFCKLESQWEDAVTLCDLALSENEEGLLEEVQTEKNILERKLEKLRLETLFSGNHDDCDAILTLHAGAGGTEAQDWANMLLRMYQRFAERQGFSCQILDFLDGEEAGIKNATIEVKGNNAYGYLKSEMGVHRLVRISPFDSSSRRHTSFASVECMPVLSDALEVTISAEDIKMDTFRASGAGGQHVNKTDSAVRLTHIPTGVVCACQSERSQHQNKDTALKMLKAKLLQLAEKEHKEKIEDLKGVQMEIGWGSQIRSYVFHPYSMVKDHRTGHEVGNVGAVMDGDLEGFVVAFLSSGCREGGE